MTDSARPAAIEALVAALYADDALRQALTDARTATDIHARVGSRPPGLDAAALEHRMAAPRGNRETLPADPRDWYPNGGHEQDGKLRWNWHYAGNVAFQAPFYFDDLRTASARALNRLIDFRAPLAALAGLRGSRPELPLAGVILHMSRCGSTWLGQLLAHDPANLVFREPTPIDSLLEHALRHGLSDADVIADLRAVVAIFGRRRAPQQQRLFLKLDAWHTRALPLLRAAFPDVPFLFLHRDPVEVMVSHRRRRGRHMVAGVIDPLWFGDRPETVDASDLDAYGVWVLARIVEAVLAHSDATQVTSVAYPRLAETFPDRIATLFGLDSGRCREALSARAERDAKASEHPFHDDRAAKQQAADPRLRCLIDAELAGLCARLPC